MERLRHLRLVSILALFIFFPAATFGAASYNPKEGIIPLIGIGGPIDITITRVLEGVEYLDADLNVIQHMAVRTGTELHTFYIRYAANVPPELWLPSVTNIVKESRFFSIVSGPTYIPDKKAWKVTFNSSIPNYLRSSPQVTVFDSSVDKDNRRCIISYREGDIDRLSSAYSIINENDYVSSSFDESFYIITLPETFDPSSPLFIAGRQQYGTYLLNYDSNEVCDFNVTGVWADFSQPPYTDTGAEKSYTMTAESSDQSILPNSNIYFTGPKRRIGYGRFGIEGHEVIREIPNPYFVSYRIAGKVIKPGRVSVTISIVSGGQKSSIVIAHNQYINGPLVVQPPDFGPNPRAYGGRRVQAVAHAGNGVPPYTYSWQLMNKDFSPVQGISLPALPTIEFETPEYALYLLRNTVSDSDGNVVSSAPVYYDNTRCRSGIGFKYPVLLGGGLREDGQYHIRIPMETFSNETTRVYHTTVSLKVAYPDLSPDWDWSQVPPGYPRPEQIINDIPIDIAPGNPRDAWYDFTIPPKTIAIVDGIQREVVLSSAEITFASTGIAQVHANGNLSIELAKVIPAWDSFGVSEISPGGVLDCRAFAVGGAGSWGYIWSCVDQNGMIVPIPYPSGNHVTFSLSSGGDFTVTCLARDLWGNQLARQSTVNVVKTIVQTGDSVVYLDNSSYFSIPLKVDSSKYPVRGKIYLYVPPLDDNGLERELLTQDFIINKVDENGMAMIPIHCYKIKGIAYCRILSVENGKVGDVNGVMLRGSSTGNGDTSDFDKMIPKVAGLSISVASLTGIQQDVAGKVFGEAFMYTKLHNEKKPDSFVSIREDGSRGDLQVKIYLNDTMVVDSQLSPGGRSFNVPFGKEGIYSIRAVVTATTGVGTVSGPISCERRLVVDWTAPRWSTVVAASDSANPQASAQWEMPPVFNWYDNFTLALNDNSRVDNLELRKRKLAIFSINDCAVSIDTKSPSGLDLAKSKFYLLNQLGKFKGEYCYGVPLAWYDMTTGYYCFSGFSAMSGASQDSGPIWDLGGELVDKCGNKTDTFTALNNMLYFSSAARAKDDAQEKYNAFSSNPIRYISAPPYALVVTKNGDNDVSHEMPKVGANYIIPDPERLTARLGSNNGLLVSGTKKYTFSYLDFAGEWRKATYNFNGEGGQELFLGSDDGGGYVYNYARPHVITDDEGWEIECSLENVDISEEGIKSFEDSNITRFPFSPPFETTATVYAPVAFNVNPYKSETEKYCTPAVWPSKPSWKSSPDSFLCHISPVPANALYEHWGSNYNIQRVANGSELGDDGNFMVIPDSGLSHFLTPCQAARAKASSMVSRISSLIGP